MKLGQLLGALYIFIALIFIWSQGLFGESFIGIILGLPWSLIPSFFEFWSVEGILLYLLILVPIGFNAFLLYVFGKWLERKRP